MERSPVLSLTILDGRTVPGGVVQRDSRVLVVVRTPEANPTHPNVVSVPTQRLPECSYERILESASGSGADGSWTWYFEGGEVGSESHDSHDPVVNAVDALLSRKLGLADSLELASVSYRAALRSRVDGTAVYEGTGTRDGCESISMLNVVVTLLTGAGELPSSTASYSPIEWVSVGNFVHGVDGRDPALMSPALDPIELCVHGVCLAAARASLKHALDTPMPAREHALPRA